MIDIENKEFVDDFSDYLRIDKNYSENTVESYMRDLKYFLTYTDKEILNITNKIEEKTNEWESLANKVE